MIVWAVVLSMLMQFSLSPNVAATSFFVEVGGRVTCDSQTTCSATVSGDPPDSLDVTAGDSVYIYGVELAFAENCSIFGNSISSNHTSSQISL